MFSASEAGRTAAGGSGRVAQASTPPGRGRGGPSGLGAFDEGHFVELAQGGDAGADFFQAGFAQEAHPFLPGRLLDFGGGLLVDDHFADAVAQVEQLADGGAAAEAGPVALDAAGAFVERYVLPLGVRPAGIP